METLMNYLQNTGKKTTVSFLIVLIISFIFHSCIMIDWLTTTSFSIKNESSVTVEIDKPKLYYNYLYDIVSFYNTDTIFTIQSQKEFYQENNEEDMIKDYPINFFGDSVLIVFNKRDSVFYTRKTPETGNILNIENYSVRKKKKHWYHYEFVITEYDYQNAIKK